MSTLFFLRNTSESFLISTVEQYMESYSNLSKMLSKSVALSRPWVADSLLCCQSTKRAQGSGCLSSLVYLQGWTAGFLWLFAFPFSNLFIHFRQICLPSPNPLSSFNPSFPFPNLWGLLNVFHSFCWFFIRGFLWWIQRFVSGLQCSMRMKCSGTTVAAFRIPPALPAAVTGSDLCHCGKKLKASGSGFPVYLS